MRKCHHTCSLVCMPTVLRWEQVQGKRAWGCGDMGAAMALYWTKSRHSYYVNFREQAGSPTFRKVCWFPLVANIIRGQLPVSSQLSRAVC